MNGKTYTDGKGTSYTYSASGRMHTRRWARNITTTYGYNTAGEMESVDYSDSTPDVSLTYDRAGRIKTEGNDVAGTLFSYSTDGRTIQQDLVIAGVEMQMIEGLDTRFRRNSLRALMGSYELRTDYGYDDASRLSSLTDDGSGNSIHFDYETSSSLVKKIRYWNGWLEAEVAATAKTWDRLNRVRTLTTTKRTGRVVSSFDYRYDSLGRRTEAHQEDGTYWDYGYDGLDQVVAGQKRLRGGEDLDGWQYGYAYDGIGNRTGTTVNGRPATYTPNALNQYTQRTVPGAVDAVGVADPQATVTVNGVASQRQLQFFHGEVSCDNTTQPVWQQVTVRSELTSASAEEVTGHAYVPKTAEAFTHDDDGNLLTDGRWQYTWDGENRLIRMESIASVPAAAKRKLVFDYDRRSRRVRKTVYDWDAGTGQYKTTGSATLYLWDGWTLVAEGSPTGTGKRGYLWNTAEGHKSLVGVSSIGDATTTDVFAVVDGNDNVRGLLSPATGDPIAVYEYGPFAEPIRETGPSVTATPIRFSSEYRDAETGLVYYGYRYYAPGVGRWVSRDPMGEHGGLNRYTFVRNRPADLVDYLGLANLSEKLWCVSHPVCCCAARNSDVDIRAEMSKRYPKWDDNTVENSVQHCAWMCYVASMKSCTILDAIELGKAHEDYAGNPAHDKAMDLYNNSKGVGMAGKDLPDCFDKCEQEAKAHRLYWWKSVVVAPPRQGLPSDFPGFTIDEDGRVSGGAVGSSSTTPPVGPTPPTGP